MSKIYCASQYDKPFKPHMLGNWEVPDAKKPASPSPNDPNKTADGRTLPLVDARGHLLGKKRAAAFNKQPPVYAQSAARWPQANPTIKGTATATMGYKGIETDYLPASTVPLKTVVLPGCKEFCYH